MSGWERTVESAMPRSRYRRGWLIWFLWGFVGTALTLEGADGGAQLATAFWLSTPFWIAFAFWPVFALWRMLYDRKLAVREIVPFATEALAMSYFRERDGVRIAENLLLDYIAGEGLSESAFGLPAADIDPRPQAGVPVAVWKLATLLTWAGSLPADTPPAVARLREWLYALENAERFGA